MTRQSRRSRRIWVTIPRRLRYAGAAVAAFPLLQATGCYPDPIGALSFELQSLVNTVLLNAVNTVVANLLRL